MATKKASKKKAASKKKVSKKKAAARKAPAKKKTAAKKKAPEKKAAAPEKPLQVRQVGGRQVSAESDRALNKLVEEQIKGKSVVGRSSILLLDPKTVVVVGGFNPRIDMGDMASLRRSVKRNGVKVPITVRKVGKHYELINGHRRLRASLDEALDTIPAIEEKGKLSAEEQMNLALVTNDGKPLAPVEEADAFRRLVNAGWTAKQIATSTGKSLRLVQDRLTLIAAHPDVAKAVKSGKLSVGLGLQIAKKAKTNKKKQAEKVKEATKGKTAQKRVAAEMGKATLRAKFDKKKIALQNRLNKLITMVNKRLKKKDSLPTTLVGQVDRFSKHPNKEVRAAFVAGGVAAITDVLAGAKPAKTPKRKVTAKAKTGNRRKNA